MHVTLEINGRQALPVRAIPLLTDWRGLSPDQLAHILAGDADHWPSFDGLTAYRLHPDGSTEPILPRWWASWVVRPLQATSDAIKAKQVSHETGYQQWRGESLAHLPVGAFVWRDEFEAAHTQEYGPEGLRARGNPEGFDPSVHILNFNPHPDPVIAPSYLVLEGFERLIPAPPAPGQLATEREAEEKEFKAGFYDAHINLGNWAALHDVKPNDAAMLLCRHDPDKGQQHTAKDFLMLARRFADHAQQYPGPRRLAQWWNVALEWMEARRLGFITLNRDLGEALMQLDAQQHPVTEAVPVKSVEPDSTAAAAPVQPETAPPSNEPLSLTTGDIAFCFDGIRWSERQWRKPLGDKPKWLKSCVAIPGVQGVSETRWNPVLIAAALVNNGHAKARIVRARFQKQPLLLAWLDAWKTYEADYLDSD